VREGGRLQTPAVAMEEQAWGSSRARILSAVLVLELVWVVLTTAAVVFLAAHLGSRAEEFTGDKAVRSVLLVAVPPAAVLVCLALIGARQALEHVAEAPHAPLGRLLRLALWVSAAANTVVVVSIATSLYHAHMTWFVVGVLLAAGLSVVAWTCARTARLHQSALLVGGDRPQDVEVGRPPGGEGAGEQPRQRGEDDEHDDLGDGNSEDDALVVQRGHDRPTE